MFNLSSSLLFLVVVVTLEYELKCPDSGTWRLRAIGFNCSIISQYVCLFRYPERAYHETCDGLDYSNTGSKLIYEPYFNKAYCSYERFQPFPFSTDGSSQCVYQKSVCSEKGQYMFQRGSQRSDITCGCDLTRGYEFVTKPKHECYCVPSEDDCSCHKLPCNDLVDQCPRDKDESITRSIITTIKENRFNDAINIFHNENNGKQYRFQCLYITSVLLAAMIIVVTMVFTLFECIKAHFILKPAESITIIEGHSVRLEFKLLVNGFAHEFRRNNLPIGDANNINTDEAGRSKILTITNITLSDKGEYCMESAGIKSKPTTLIVKKLFKRRLQDINSVEGSRTIFECESEKDNSAVEWFQGDTRITDNTEKVVKEDGHIYKLTIEHTFVKHGGTYKIKKNGILSTAALKVKALFKQPLKKTHILEGSSTVFECETEKERGGVEWLNGEDKITDNIETIEKPEGYIYKLTIKHARLKHSGTYRIKKNCICSEATLEVQALFKRQLENLTIMEGLDIQLECETEEGSSSVKWFKDGVLTANTESTKQETFSGNIHKLTISPARLKDSGRYMIEINGIRSEAVLDVKGMPDTIKQMSKHDREEFLKATKSGTTRRHYLRVLIVGESSAGKTCLLRRLMNKPIDDVISTDGLDIERGTCQVDIKTGEWYFPTTDRDSYSVWSGKHEQLADCGFWDFAGPKEFYATHQTFLCKNAVYLLVVDISKDFSKKTYNDMLEDKFDSLGEKIGFWLDNIHCYRTDFDNASNQWSEELNPPVVIVGTGIDKIPLDERENSQQLFQNHLRKILSHHEKRRHIRKILLLSNKFPSDNGQEFKQLRYEIYHHAKILTNWEDNLPTRWIVLEKVIHSIISDANYTMSYAEAIELAGKCSFPNLKETTSELDSFLKYEHDIGNIIFFDDMKDFIILDLKWLVAVFKCFVSNQYDNELKQRTEWTKLEKEGKLSNNLIDKLLEKVPHIHMIEHSIVIRIMEIFDIIVRPINDEASEIFYLPSMIKHKAFQNIIRGVGAEKCKKKTSWFMLEFDFLPPSYFNHILVRFVKDKKLWTEKDNQLCIYRNIGLFDISDARTRVLMICFSKNTIAMQVLQWNLERHCYSEIKSKLIDIVLSMKLRYRINITYMKKFKCSEGNCFETEGRVDFDTALAENDYRCTEHNDTHQMKDILKSWLTEKEIEEYKNKDNRKCNFCENMSVYKCYDCNIVLCKHCSRIHDYENKGRIHVMQLDRDSFICNKLRVGGRLIYSIKCLSNGLLIEAGYNFYNKQSEIVTISVSGEKRHVTNLQNNPKRMDVLDTKTVAVFLENNSVAIVDIEQICVQYIPNIAIKQSLGSFICIENQFYVCEGLGITVIDKKGDKIRRIELSFEPYDLCYDVESQHIYCIYSIDRGNSELSCIAINGYTEFTFALPSIIEIVISLTLDNEGNVLVLLKNKGDTSGCVIKVNSKGKSSDVVITNIHLPRTVSSACICFDHSTDSVVIGVHNTVYIYKKEEKVYKRFL